MSDAAEPQQRLARRHAELVWLVRHQLALRDHGTYADGIAPDSVAFAQTWVRAKVRRAVGWGALADERDDPDETSGR